MINKLKQILVFPASILFLCCLFFPRTANSITLTTASKDGNYYPTGMAISKVLKDNGYDGVTVIESMGSIDNISKLINREADLAIVQSDILYRAFFAEKGDAFYPLKNGIRELRGILALYPEFVQIMVREDSPINRITSLAKKKIYIGKDNSGTIQNARDILGYYRINENDFTRSLPEKNLTDALATLFKGEIDAVFFTSGELIINRPEFAEQKIKLVSLDKEMAFKISREKPCYTYKEIKDKKCNFTNVIFTRAILVARGQDKDIIQGMRHEDAAKIAKILYENQLELEKEVQQDLPFFRGELMVRKIPFSIHAGAEEYFISKDILVRTTLVDFTIIALGLIWGLIILGHWGLRWKWVKWIRELRIIQWLYDRSLIRVLWDSFMRVTTSSVIATTTLLLLFSLMIVIRVIIYFERLYSIEFDILNPFAEKSYLDTFYWVMTFAFTGFPQGVFPNSYPGKIAAAIIPIIGVGSAVFLIVYGNIKRNNRVDKEARGMIVPKLKNHVVICGWNDRVPSLIWEITSNDLVNSNRKVIVIAEIDKEKPLDEYNFKGRKVYYLRGISSDYENLKRASISKSFCCVVVAGHKKITEKNIRSIFTTAALKNVSEEAGKYKLRIIAEVFYRENDKYYVQSGATKLVCLQSTSTRMISHAILNPGISDILLNFLSFDPPYTASLLDVSHPKLKIRSNLLIGKTFRQALLALRERDMLLIAIYKSDILTEHNPLELEFRNEDSPYIVNPIDEEEKETINENNHLLVIQSKRTKGFERGSAVGGKAELFTMSSKTSHFILGKEHILVIGNEESTQKIVDSLERYCKKIVHLVLGKKSPSDEKDQTIKLYLSELNDRTVRENQIHFEKITRVIILAPSRDEVSITRGIYHDDHTMILAATLIDIYKNLFQKENIHIAAELRNIKNLQLFHAIGIVQPIPTNQLIERILAQMVFHSGVISEFFLKTMSYSKSNTKTRLEKISVAELSDDVKNRIRGNNYDIALKELLDNRMQLLAIEKLNGKIVLNPKYKSDDVYVEDKDYLYVFTKPNT